MRLKLCRNYEFNPHTDASNLRDNTVLLLAGWQSRKSSGDVPLSLNISQAAVRRGADDSEHADEDLISLPQQDADAEFDVGEDTGKEKLLMSQECELVTLMHVVKGRLDISTMNLYFHDLSPVREDIDRHDFKWSLSKLREVFLRRYNLRRSALEFFLTDQTNYFLNFTPKIRNRVVSRLLSLRPPNLSYHSTRPPSDLLRISGLTQKWVNREISNFDYLMQLNTIAGRTYNDLSQYPIFPWILADYTSDFLDLTNPATFRDLSLPIGVVNKRNEAEVRSKYENFEDPTGTIAKFHYGTHYSNSAGVLHYLVRVEPFTSLHIELQSGRFDVADRQFHSIPQTWKLLMDSPNDVKELIPEFFYFPEFLKNMNGFDLGHLQGSKERVDDVILPNWATSAEDFIFKHRKALESEYVSANLHKWIDLIFGFKQKGPAAVDALNVFFYCSYEGAVDLDAISDPLEREAVEGMINNFGQTPTQLLREPHPQRLPASDALAKMLRSDLKKPDLTMFLDKLATFHIPVTTERDSLVFVSVPRSPPRGLFQNVIADCLVTISKSGLIGQHSWLPYEKHSAKGFALDIDSSLSNPKLCRSISGSFHPSVTLNNQMFAVSHDAKYLLSSGHWDSSIKVFSLIKGKTVISLTHHQDIVTCLALDACGWYLVSGSKDCTTVIWDIHQMPSVTPKAIATLCGHDQPITSVAVSTELDMVVSGSEDGTVNVYTIHGGQFIRSIWPIGCNPKTTKVTFVGLSFQGHLAFSARDSSSGDSVHVYSVNGENLGSKLVSGRVTGLATVSHCLVVVDDAGDLTMSRLLGLHPVYDVPLHVPVQGIVVTSANTHMLIPLRDGNLAVIGLPNTIQKP
ncbi:unnamed protein product [Bemisia tabaci]|uniref:Uncharacterized protein n=1 Tax=Bemisia tabaci TaxID=7038 RepID=A0A9P0A685_BEMTA|nr:unnamed protein product [Bemisia tabaci]